ncbi:MAG: T9SS C-terminal target domain-containing protein, partial [Ignavibacteriae bacterium]
VAQAGTMSLVPNPAHETVNVQYHLETGSVQSIAIYDMMGHVVRTIPVAAGVSDGIARVNCSDLPSGAYIVRLVLAGGHIDGMLHILR